MRTTKKERIRAEQVSAAVDQVVQDPSGQPGRLDPADAGLLDTARHLARLPWLLGPLDPVLEQRVMRRVRAAETGQAQRLPRFRPAWVAGGLAAVLFAVMMLTPLGQTAVASFMAVFDLGRTEVRITPVDTQSAPSSTGVAGDAAVQQSLTLADAQAQVAFSIPRPAYLPSGYRLREVKAYTYPDLPAWVPQPFFVELVYEDASERKCTLRIYPITLGDGASISGMNLEAAPIRDVRDVDVNGQHGVLLQLGTGRPEAAWQEMVWEQDDLILALSATDLSEADLLDIARSVR